MPYISKQVLHCCYQTGTQDFGLFESVKKQHRLEINSVETDGVLHQPTADSLVFCLGVRSLGVIPVPLIFVLTSCHY
ncbi:hypothetical protein HanPSC8_Chr13g0564691 [Helianthus annuus]|nr:hypothetical protein HanPSC8_Chr13g0564691 [Helianthus annuus]